MHLRNIRVGGLCAPGQTAKAVKKPGDSPNTLPSKVLTAPPGNVLEF